MVCKGFQVILLHLSLVCGLLDCFVEIVKVDLLEAPSQSPTEQRENHFFHFFDLHWLNGKLFVNVFKLIRFKGCHCMKGVLAWRKSI